MQKEKFKRLVKTCVLAILIAGAAIVTPVAIARADLLILPIRVVFKDRDKMQGVTVMNTSDKNATFRLSFYYQKQVEGGGYQKVDGPITPECDMEKMMVFSPRQISLPPGGKQAIRLSLRRPPEQPDGECRIHLKMQRLAPAERPIPEENLKKDTVSTKLNINVGFSIPVMMRQGKYDSSAKITDAKIVRGEKSDQSDMLTFTVNRQGKFSTLGSMQALWTPADGGDEKEVGRLNDINVYAESPRRLVKMALREKGLTNGKMRLVYEGGDADKGITFDEVNVPLK